MWRSLWHHGIVSLVAAAACAAGLSRSSLEGVATGRALLLDAVPPGARGVQWLQDCYRLAAESARQSLAVWVHAPAEAPAAPSAAAGEICVDQERFRQMEARLAHLERELNGVRSGLAGRLDVQPARPLLRPRAVPARVIDAARARDAGLGELLLDGGLSAGMARDDLAVAPSAALLDQGTEAGLSRDDPVCAGATLVGRIRHSGRATSLLQPITDTEFRIAAQILRATSEGPVIGGDGVYVGGGRGVGRLEFVPSTAPVLRGDRVYTQESVAGNGVVLYIGEVVRAELLDGAPHWNIEVAPALPRPPAQLLVLTLEPDRGQN